MEDILKFLNSQKLLVLACGSGENIWVSNVYFGTDEGGAMYFISSQRTKHSQMILKNPEIAFSVAWFDSQNHKNRKAVQGLGICRPAQNEEEIATGVKLHNERFPEFKDRITVDWVHTNDKGSKVWVIKPTFMKYWDDELYGGDESKEFSIAA